jgi:CHRD domain
MKPRRLVVALVAALLGAVAFALPAIAANDDDSGVELEAKLTGKQEVPGPGDRDGSGKAELVVGKKQVCYELRVEDIERPTGAHIHEGSRGKAGDVVVDLDPPKKGSSKKGFTSDGCERISGELSKKLRADPSHYYVNVHNKPFPDGAVRGQLREKK